MIEYLNQNSGFFNLLFSATVALATIVYAILTWKLVYETRRMRQLQSEPEISIRIIPHDEEIQFVDMVIENIGLAPAYEVEFTIIQGATLFKDPSLLDVGMIKNGIKYFSPKEKIKFYLGSFPEYLKSEEKSPIEIKVEYNNSSNEHRISTFILNFEEYLNITRLGEPSLVTIAREIKRMSDDMHYIMTGYNKLKVNIYDNDDREKEKKYYEERLKNNQNAT